MDRYSTWFPLNEEGIEASGICGAAAVQVRREQGLVDYGAGKSAMVWYGYFSEDSDRKLSEVFRDELEQPGARGQGPLLFRFYSGDATRDSMVNRARQFAKRFGGPPILNRS